MTEHKILVAFTVEADDRDLAERVLRDLLTGIRRMDHPWGEITSWWVAEDDRTDGSDNDSAVFVTPGQQRLASLVLNLAGLTPECNVVPRRVPRPTPDPDKNPGGV